MFLNFCKKNIFSIKHIIYLYIFLLPLQTRFIWKQGFLNQEYWEVATYSLYATDILLFIIFVLYIFKFFQGNVQLNFSNNKENRSRKYFVLSAVGLLLWSGLSVLWADQKIIALFSFFQLTKVFGFVVILITLKISIKNIFKFFISGVFIQALWGIGQAGYQGQFASTLLGVSSLNPQQPGVSVIEYAQNNFVIRWLRAYGGMPHPNMLGGLLGLGILAQLYFVLTSKIKWKVHVAYGVLGILLLGLMLSFSRSAWIMVVIELFSVFALLFLNKDWGKKYLLRLKKVFFVLIGVFLIVFLLQPNLMRTRLGIGDIQRLETYSIEERVTSSVQARNLLVDNFFLGVGLGNYEHAVAAVDNYKQKPWNYQPVHNIYILLFVELGVVGMLFFGLIIANLYILIYQKINENLANLELLLSSSLFEGILILGLFDHYLWTTSIGVMIFGLFIGNLYHQFGQK